MALSREQNRLRMRAVRAAAHHPGGVHGVHALSAAVEAEVASLPAVAVTSRPTAVAAARRLAAQLDGDPSSPRVALWIRELLMVLDGLRAVAPAVGGRLAELRAARR